MSHSIYSYLKRRSNEELEYALKLSLEDADVERNRDTILMILRILWERDQEAPTEISPESMERIEKILREKYGESCR